MELTDNAAQQARGRLVVISGPSGAGKSTIAREVLRRTDSEFSISATTRRPRAGEVDGRDYRFLDRQTFERMIQAGELLEWAEVFGNHYGTPAEPVRRAIAAGRTILLDIDVQGAMQVRRKMPDATFVLIVAASEDVLRERLTRRGTETAEQLARRIAKAAAEQRTARDSGIYQHCVVNDDLETAIEAVVDIVKKEPAGR